MTSRSRVDVAEAFPEPVGGVPRRRRAEPRSSRPLGRGGSLRGVARHTQKVGVATGTNAAQTRREEGSRALAGAILTGCSRVTQGLSPSGLKPAPWKRLQRGTWLENGALEAYSC